jgi:hypothetical protein
MSYRVTGVRCNTGVRCVNDRQTNRDTSHRGEAELDNAKCRLPVGFMHAYSGPATLAEPGVPCRDARWILTGPSPFHARVDRFCSLVL